MAATAAITRNPACFATSSSSTSVSSNARFPYTQTKTARAPLPRTMPNRSATTVGILPAYAGTEITATSSSVIETALKSSPLSVRSTVTVFLPSAPATRPDTFRVPPVGLNTISNTLIETPSPYAWQRVKPLSHPARVYGTWGPRFDAPSTPMLPPYAVYLFVLYKLRYRLYIFTGYRRVLPRYPIPARAKNGVFCNVTAPAPPRAGKTVGRRIILSPDMARMTRPCSGKRRNLTQNAR